jgi:hypothetical protein
MTRRYIIIALVLLAVLTVWLLWPRNQPESKSVQKSQQTSSNQDPAPAVPSATADGKPAPTLDASKQDEKRIGAIEAMRRAYNAPIVFYGKVVDEEGNPLAEAKVGYSVADNPLKDGSKYEGMSDASGSFSLSGVKGASMTVAVTKEGYYFIRGKSSGSFGYGVPNSSPDRRDIPTKETPAIFVLRKMGETVPLLAKGARVKMPKDGSPMAVDLETGRATSGNQGDLVLECWTQNEGMDPNLAQPYDWRFRLTVPGGGVVERMDQFAFKAPTEGYREVVEFAMPKDAERWKQDFEAEYFVKLGDGRYARMQFRITSGGAHFATVSSYLNPTPGSRNLEYDPAKALP